MSTEISKVKHEMHLQQWSAEIQECKESGLTVGKWCSEKGIKPKTYYYHLKQVRDSMIENKVVPICNRAMPSDKIEILSNDLKISMPIDTPGESIASIIQVLRLC